MANKYINENITNR